MILWVIRKRITRSLGLLLARVCFALFCFVSCKVTGFGWECSNDRDIGISCVEAVLDSFFSKPQVLV